MIKWIDLVFSFFAALRTDLLIIYGVSDSVSENKLPDYPPYWITFNLFGFPILAFIQTKQQSTERYYPTNERNSIMQ